MRRLSCSSAQDQPVNRATLLAEYTGYALRGTVDAETRLALARRLENVDRQSSFVHGFAYSSGPAYGLLLDAADASWRRSYSAASDLAATLGAAAKATATADPVARARAYDDGSLRASEEERNYGFDPNSVVAFGDAGTVYPSLEVSGPWGTIQTDEGARVDAARGVLLFSAADRTRLKLNAGWVLKPGARPGDLLLSSSP